MVLNDICAEFTFSSARCQIRPYGGPNQFALSAVFKYHPERLCRGFIQGQQKIKGLGRCARIANPNARYARNLTRVVHDVRVFEYSEVKTDLAGTHKVLAVGKVKAFHGFAVVELKLNLKTGTRRWTLNTFYLDAWCNRFKAFPRTFKA